jgi:soluble lytic murein transglycosylase
VVAAKLAQRLGLDNLAIQTAAKAGYWDDLSLRFPLGFNGPVLQAAQSQQVDPALVYALVRRESAFDPNVGSPAGALGLMQLMPATGALMARQRGEALPSANALLEPGRNLRFGTAYLRGLLERFGNHFALAAAAYNAGPNRVERWLPKGLPMPADLWVETIPYSETRQYVAAVLANVVVYQVRLGQPLRRIGDWLPHTHQFNGICSGIKGMPLRWEACFD